MLNSKQLSDFHNVSTTSRDPTMSEEVCVQQCECNFKWRIVNFSVFKYDICKPIYSPKFKIESSSGSTWKFQLIFFNGIPFIGSKFALLFFNISTNGDLSTNDHSVSNSEAKFEYSVEIMSVDGSVYHSKTNMYDANPRADYGWEDYIEKDSLQDKAIHFLSDSLIFRCWLHDTSDFPPNVQVLGETTLGVERIIFNYFVESLNSLSPPSQNFECPPSSRYTMYVGRSRNDIKIEIIKHDEPEHELEQLAMIKVTLLDLSSVERYSKTYSVRFTGDTKWITLTPFIPLTLIPREQTKLLRKIAFNLVCEFTVTNRTYSHVTEMGEPESSRSCNKITGIQEKLLSLYSKPKHSDLKLQVGDKSFQVHRFVLSSRSRIFSELIENSKTDFLLIMDVEYQILEAFLKFLYSGIVEPLNYETATNLLMLADKYEVPLLKDKCLCFLKQIMSEKVITSESP